MNPVEDIESVHKTAGKSQIYSHSVVTTNLLDGEQRTFTQIDAEFFRVFPNCALALGRIVEEKSRMQKLGVWKAKDMRPIDVLMGRVRYV